MAVTARGIAVDAVPLDDKLAAGQPVTAALRQYNLDRNYAAVFRQERPSLAQGQVVKVPPARILERAYPTAIPGVTRMRRARLPPCSRPSSVRHDPMPCPGIGWTSS